MTPAEAVAQLDAITADNPKYASSLFHGSLSIQDAHIGADNVLRELIRTIAPEVNDAYERLRDRTDDWWYA